MSGGWRKLHNEELNDLYSLPNIIWGDQIEKNEMGEAFNTLGEERCTRGFDVETLDRRIVLRWILRKWDWGPWTGLSWLKIGTDGGHL